uniref:WAP domain-containing protein n=1 Tax=Pseudonaja textilis TaxID=8673 RepID=A0A670ZSR5_PSETE
SPDSRIGSPLSRTSSALQHPLSLTGFALHPLWEKPGFCPPSPRGASGPCWTRCLHDGSCPEMEKCCSYGCALYCMKPVTGETHSQVLPVGRGNCRLRCRKRGECRGGTQIFLLPALWVWRDGRGHVTASAWLLLFPVRPHALLLLFCLLGLREASWVKQ